MMTPSKIPTNQVVMENVTGEDLESPQQKYHLRKHPKLQEFADLGMDNN